MLRASGVGHDEYMRSVGLTGTALATTLFGLIVAAVLAAYSPTAR